MAPIRPAEAKARLHATGEIACLDVREQGSYGEGHPFLAVPCPYSRLETRVVSLVPRLRAPILLVDDGDGLAERAAARLSRIGYAEVDWIDGGAPAWVAAGYSLFKGVNVPSKTLGELVEHCLDVPHIGPETLENWLRQGREVQVFDGRSATEYAKMTIPGSRCMPNGELAHRWDVIVGKATRPVVVNCAGRTRSIIGAAGLILTGASEVYALQNGTQGWALSGRVLEPGSQAGPLPPADDWASRQRARSLAEARRIEWIGLEAAREFAGDANRTTYLFDVRDPAEHEATPHAAAVSAPGGQLVQATDQWIGVRRARVILADDTGLRATLAAFWLRLLGYEVFVLPDLVTWPVDWHLDSRDLPRCPELSKPPVLPVREALERYRNGDTLLDLRPSISYRAAHLPGARWSTRSQLPQAPPRSSVILIGTSEAVSLASLDLREAGVADLWCIEGDETEWRAAGVRLLATPDVPSDADAIDYLFFVHDRHDGNMAAAQSYLDWEMGLIAQLDAQERGEYRLEDLHA
jgi:rhodanese-related sulfurtransferase